MQTKFETTCATLDFFVVIHNVTNAGFMQEEYARRYYDECCANSYDLPNVDIHLVRWDHECDKAETLARFGVKHSEIWSSSA